MKMMVTGKIGKGKTTFIQNLIKSEKLNNVKVFFSGNEFSKIEVCKFYKMEKIDMKFIMDNIDNTEDETIIIEIPNLTYGINSNLYEELYGLKCNVIIETYTNYELMDDKTKKCFDKWEHIVINQRENSRDK